MLYDPNYGKHLLYSHTEKKKTIKFAMETSPWDI